jgi:Rhodopirellula transposase DDE domain
MAIAVETEQVLAGKLSVILPHLDERQQRLLLGVEARALGHGGIRVVARAAGVAEARVSRGVAEVEAGAAPLGRVRRPGGGRKSVIETDPGVVAALLGLVEPQERGDPMSPLRWTTKSLRRLAAELGRQGHRIGVDTVAELLRREGFSLQANAKTLEGRQHPDRDGQFRYIAEQVAGYQATADPVISVDAKKKELVGEYRNPGRRWRPKGAPVAVRDHDFAEDDTPRAAPYGVYDLAANTGWVNVGTDHDTAAFAVESIRRWWRGTGAADYPHATRLLITADAGGSNNHRHRAWKIELAALALQTGLAITVCHFPPGTSKWNKIEHRLFSHITLNWAGRPLTSHEVVVQTIAATTTRTGLRVHAELDPNHYPTGVRYPAHHHDALPLQRHTWHGDWNYTLRPEPYQITEPVDPRQPHDHVSDEYAWLTHPTITGLSTPDWNTLVTDTAALHTQRQPIRRGRAPRLTLADKLLAAMLYERHKLPQAHIAALFHTPYNIINRHICDTLALLDDTDHTIPTSPHKLTNLDDLHALANTGNTTPKTSKHRHA